MLTFRKWQDGSWAVYGPRTELKPGAVKVTRKDGSIVTQVVVTVSQPTWIHGVAYVYGFPTQQAAPQQAAPQQAVPQQAVPQQAVPQQAVPQQAVPQQAAPQQAAPSARWFLVMYDIPDHLQIPNPTPAFRRNGIRVNLSCWIFPAHLAPRDYIADLRAKGASVRVVPFTPTDENQILEIAQDELRRHARHESALLNEKCAQLRAMLERHTLSEDDELRVKGLRRWRGLVAKARRELVAAEQCALGFRVNREVAEMLQGLHSAIVAEQAVLELWAAETAAVAVPA